MVDRRLRSNLTPSQNLKLQQGRDPELRPSQVLTISGGRVGEKGDAEEKLREEARREELANAEREAQQARLQNDAVRLQRANERVRQAKFAVKYKLNKSSRQEQTRKQQQIVFNEEKPSSPATPEIQPAPPRGFRDSLTLAVDKSRTQVDFGKTTIPTQLKGFGAGVTLSFLSTYDFLKNPVEGFKSLKNIPENLATVGPLIVQNPSVAAGYLTGEFLQFKAVKSAAESFKPTTTTKPIRPVASPTGTQVNIPLVVDGKKTFVSSIRITGETKPPLLKTTTTPIRKFFGRSPIKSEIIPPKGYLTESLTPIVEGKTYVVGTTTTRSSKGLVSTVGGVSEVVSPKTLKGLSKIQEFTITQSLQKKLGVPVSSSTAPKIFSRSAKLDIGEVTTVKQAILSNKEFLSVKPGSRVSQSSTFTRTEPLFKTKDFMVTKEVTTFKDITKPFARATGKTSTLNTQVFTFEKPIIFDSGRSGSVINPGKGLKTSQLQKTVVPKPSPPPVGTVRTTTTQGSSKITSITSAPVITGVVRPVVTDNQVGVKQTSVQTKVTNGVFIETKPKGDIGSLSKVDTVVGTSSKNFQRPVQQPITNQIPTSIQRPVNRPVQKFIPKLAQRPLQKTLQKSVVKAPSTTKGFFGVKTVKTSGLFFPLLKGFKSLSKEKGLFGVEVKRKGKFRSVGKGLSKSEALSLGTKITGSTLAASFKITGPGSVGIPKGFRKSKKNPNVIVEKRQFRLSKTPEIRGIQLAKKRKRKKKR